MYAVEVEVLETVDAPDRDEFLIEAAKAYRAREKCSKVLGRLVAAEADVKRAAELETEAKKIASKRPAIGQVEIVNTWTQPATLMIDGVAYRVDVGERKTIRRPAGSFTYSLVEGNGSNATGNVEAGKTMTIKIAARQGS